MRNFKTKLLAILCLSLICVCAGALQAKTPFSLEGEIHNYELITHEGTPFDPTDLLGKVVLMVFGFTACPDVCPAELSRVSALLNEIKSDSVAALFVSLDPARDSAQNLADYLPYFHSDITGLTGTSDQITALASSLGVRFEQIDNGTEYSIDHSTGVYVLDGDGQVQAIAPLGSGVDHLKRIVLNLL